MRIYQINENDSKRVKLLKTCAQNLHNELMEYASKPHKNQFDLTERHLQAAIYKLNVRIRKAMKEQADESQLAIAYPEKRRGALKMFSIWIRRTFAR